MGTFKEQIAENEDYYRAAKEILLEIGEIALCDKHPDSDYFYRMYKYDDKKAIYGIATDKLKVYHPNMTNYIVFHKQVDTVLKDADEGNHCPICDKVNND